MRPARPFPLRTPRALAAALVLTGLARAQGYGVSYSIDWNSPTVGVADSLGGLWITEGDLLLAPAPSMQPAYGPLPPPSELIKAGSPSGPFASLGLIHHAACYGHPGGTPCDVEVDAIDLGIAPPLHPGTVLSGRLYLSADRFARGFGAPAAPSIWSEGAIGDLAADVLVDLGLGPIAGPMAPFAAANVGSTVVLDGDGLASSSGFVRPGLGLEESAGAGDDLDALAFLPAIPQTPGGFPASGVLFSLDSAILDPVSGRAGSGSAAAHGFHGGDIVHCVAPGAAPVLWAGAAQLGLDLVAGPDSDDLDALVVWENGTPGFQPSAVPFDWSQGATDMVLFSVRRGSAVVGQIDSLLGLPIQPGDVLTTPRAGGATPYPGILIACENLGLAGVGVGRVGGSTPWGDDLDALELAPTALRDCNGNGIDDAVDIATGASSDGNNNGVPDECEQSSWTAFCHCTPPLGPCGNSTGFGGCANSTGQGAVIVPNGSASASSDDLVLHTVQMPPNKGCLTFCSASFQPPAPFFDGRRCVASPVSRFPLQSSGPGGQASLGPNLGAWAATHFSPAHAFVAGASIGFQTWYRDPSGPCGGSSNLSSALRVNFTP